MPNQPKEFDPKQHEATPGSDGKDFDPTKHPEYEHETEAPREANPRAPREEPTHRTRPKPGPMPRKSRPARSVPKDPQQPSML